MLFDLSSPGRKRVVQVVYATLAILMGGSLVLFGIGSDAPGGILDALGLGGGSSSSGSAQYEEQIENAEEKLATDPKNEAALLNLVRYHYLSATSEGAVAVDPATGAVEISEDGRAELEETVAAWERYLKAGPQQPDSSAASNAATAYRLLGDTDGAASAQAVVAEEQKTGSAYAQLAQYLYIDLQFKEADEAAKKAIAAVDPADRKPIAKSFEALEERARKYEKQIEEQAEAGTPKPGEEAPADPFGAIGGPGGPALSVPPPSG